jgi:NDP-sugar pyrophosphorylase family protein
MSMKAVLLAAGRGERIRDVVDTVPKPMIEISGKPILQQNVEWLVRFAVTDLYINLHHLPDVIEGHFGDGSKWDANIRYSYEERLLGTAGATRKIADDYWGAVDKPFLVVYGDNLLSEFDLTAVLDFHQANRGIGTMCLYHRDDVSQSGIAVLDESRRITRFIEKPGPAEAISHWVNAGIYVLEPEILKYIPEGQPYDFGRDVFPNVLAVGETLFGMVSDAHLIAVDTPELLTNAMRRSKAT